MDNISKQEKLELLETWKETLQGDIEQYTTEVESQLEKKNKALEYYNKRIKNITAAITRAQNRVDKTRIQIDDIDKEVRKLKEDLID